MSKKLLKIEDLELSFKMYEGLSYVLKKINLELSKGEMYVVPKGVEHKPYAEKECHIMLIEPRGVVNTGEVKNKLTSKNDNWIYI